MDTSTLVCWIQYEKCFQQRDVKNGGFDRFLFEEQKESAKLHFDDT